MPLLLLSQFQARSPPPALAVSNAEATGARLIFQATNDYRADNGRGSLWRAGLIDNVAQKWAERMLSDYKRHGSHTAALRHNPNFGAQMPSTGMLSAAENIAFACGYGGATNTANRLMTGWIGSPGHRANMLNNSLTHIGVGFAYDSSSDCGYGVQNFGRYAQQFFDVPRSHPHYSDINWLANSGITTGYASGNFHPRTTVLRETFAAFLYRQAGSPAVSLPSRSPFSDVSANAPFYKEIVWLSRSGVTTGYEDGTFRPKKQVSREEMAAFLYRSAGRPPVSPTSATRFSDMNSNSRFLREISWMYNEGITTGFGDNTFRPTATVTRDTAAAFLRRSDG